MLAESCFKLEREKKKVGECVWCEGKAFDFIAMA
jgi:hypothetical protein